MKLTDEQRAELSNVFDDAWYYRLGEARDLHDPDLDPGDREILVRQAKLSGELGL